MEEIDLEASKFILVVLRFPELYILYVRGINVTAVPE